MVNEIILKSYTPVASYEIIILYYILYFYCHDHEIHCKTIMQKFVTKRISRVDTEVIKFIYYLNKYLSLL